MDNIAQFNNDVEKNIDELGKNKKLKAVINLAPAITAVKIISIL